MGDFRVHQVRFFNYKPEAIHCLAYEHSHQKLALSRSDGSVEIWNEKDHWFQEQTMPPVEGGSVEGLVWSGPRLFSAGLHGHLYEHDLLTCGVKHSVSSNSGAIWCLAVNNVSNGTMIAAGTEEGCVVLYDISEEEILYSKALDKQEGRILSLAWHHRENMIVTGGMDNIRIWSVHSGHAVQRLTLGRQDKNTETIVWALAITSDFTIVSGDSRGKTCFWNGKQGTLIKAFQAHKADVLAVCVNPEGNSVFSSGIDPQIVQFEFIPASANSDWKNWVKSWVRSQHTHDVRALAVSQNCIISAGVDCQLIMNQLQSTLGIKSWRRYAPIPHTSLVQTAKAAKMVLLRYSDSVELWRLGSTDRKSEESGEILPLSRNPAKLLELKARSWDHISACAVADNAEWLAYSTPSSIRLFQLTVEGQDESCPRVSVSKVRYLPPGVLPSHCLIFTPDNDHLVSATCQGSVQLLKMDSVQPALLHTFVPPKTDGGEHVHLLSVSPSGRYVATGDHNSRIHVYSITKLEHVCTLPRKDSQPTALGFHPTQPLICVAYADQMICEYNIAQCEYTEWSRQLTRQRVHPQWLKRHSKVMQIIYHPQLPHQIWLRDEQTFCIIDKSQPLPSPSTAILSKSTWAQDDRAAKVQHAFHMCSKFKYLLHLDILDEDFVVLVERPPLAITETLPDPLKQKKFGT